MGALAPHPQGTLYAGLFCLALAAALLVKAAVPRWRRMWGWGWCGCVPLSLAGHLGVAAGFVLIGAGSIGAYLRPAEGSSYALLVFLGFAVFMASGLYDNRREARTGRKEAQAGRRKESTR